MDFFFASARANINEGLANILSASTHIALIHLCRPGFETPQGAFEESICPSTFILDAALILIRFGTGMGSGYGLSIYSNFC
jgi:hypothetical protein